MRVGKVFLFGVIAIVVACNSVKILLPAGGSRYVLRTIDGRTLPAEYAANPDFHGVILTDTLVLGVDGHGTWNATVRDPGSASTRTEHTSFDVTQTGNEISITFICPDNASCLRGPHFVGQVTAQGIVVDESAITRTPLVFDRVP